jgi:glycosyltransferase involved in cell wall biosynthesis
MVVENAALPRDPRVWSESLALRELGFDVEAISPTRPERDDGTAYDEQDGVPIFRFRASASDGSFLGYLREYAVASWRILQLAHRRSRRRPFDVIHVANPPDVLLLALLPLKRSTKFVFDHHDLSPELYDVRFPHRRGGGRRPTNHGAPQLHARRRRDLGEPVVPPARRRARRRRSGRVFVVRNAPDPNVMKPGRADPSLKRGRRFLITYAGLMDSQDGVELAVDALAELRTLRDDWHALLVGAGPELEGCASGRTALGLDDVVEFPGWVSERDRVRLILDTSDVCLSPSRRIPSTTRRR